MERNALRDAARSVDDGNSSMTYACYLRKQARFCLDIAEREAGADADALVELARDYEIWADTVEHKEPQAVVPATLH